jgi:ABC-type enterochelin transport system permease subunit
MTYKDNFFSGFPQTPDAVLQLHVSTLLADIVQKFREFESMNVVELDSDELAEILEAKILLEEDSI